MERLDSMSGGGKVDQNLILVDEAPLYNTAHLFGLEIELVLRLYQTQIRENPIRKNVIPITLPTGRINNLILYAKRNGFRLPDYHRLDLSMVINGNPKKTKKIRGQWVISILNVYARKNPFSYFLNSENSHSENNRYQLKQLSVFGTVVPTFSYNVKF